MPDNQIAPDGGKFQTIFANGVNLRVYTLNEGRTGLPLVICNGLGQAVEILYPLMHEFPDRPIIAFDAAGVGRSEVPETAATIPQHAAMLRQVLDDLNVDRCDVMGISWGGALAQQLAYDHPQLVHKQVLAITSAGGIGSWWGTPLALSRSCFRSAMSTRPMAILSDRSCTAARRLLQPALFKEYSKNAIRPSYEGYSAQG